MQQHDQQPHQLSCTESAGDTGIRKKIEVMNEAEKEQEQMQYENDDPDEDDPDIPDIHIAPHPLVERTADMQRFRLYSENLVRDYLEIKAGEIAQIAPGCQDECCQKEECTTTLQDWEDMVYHDLMRSQWTDESILRFEPSHEMFKKFEDRDLDILMQALRSKLNPDRARLNNLFPADGELLQDNVSENLYPRDIGERIYRMHCAEDQLLVLIMTECLRVWPEEERIERVDRERQKFRRKCIAKGVDPWKNGLTEDDDMRVRWHCTPYYM